MLKESMGELGSEAAGASASVLAVATGGEVLAGGEVPAADTAADVPGAASGGEVPAGGLWLARLSRDELASLGVAALTEVLGGVERHVNQVAGYRVEVLAGLDAAGVAEGLQGASSREAVREATGVSDRSARELCRVAAKAQRCEPVMEALAGGDINTEQAESLSDARVPDEVRHQLIAEAASEGTDQTKRRVRAAEAEHCSETAEQRFARQRAKRRAQWGTDDDGMLRIGALLDPEIGARAEAALSAISQAMWRDDKHLRVGRRTPAQRDADALAYLLTGATLSEADAKAIAKLIGQPPGGNAGPARPGGSTDSPGAAHGAVGSAEAAGAAHPAGFVHGSPGSADPAGFVHAAFASARPDVQVQVMIEYEALRGQTDAAGITDAGTELAPETVRKLACDAEIIPIMLNGPGGSADIGRARRTVPARLRRALIARDRHCVWPGCSAPPSRCDAHHIWHWAHGGPTNLVNLALLCHKHHHDLHEQNLTIKRNADGTWTIGRQPRAP
ncbi:DUF222 domain-containing protein [Candidatus Poriferisodalis sp.]|uniref:HNH endonuclease signature motif containing protein n=1 Tax=Candidatus Poriferisodalis sp. TaxID=3101277 RepID=UPI003B527E6D